jgi:tripartite-type tricarboxylate transporter receptor subunit TctC
MAVHSTYKNQETKKMKAFRSLLAAASSAVLIGPAICAGAAYPDHTVSLIVGSSAGGSTDFVARVISEGLTKELNRAVVVENKPGASGNIANYYVARAKPDGYTLLMAYSGYQAGNPNLFKSLNWDPVKDYTPVALIGAAPHVILVPAASPAKDLRSLIAEAKRHPGQISYASSGLGSIQHLGTELFKQMTGTSMVHVPYKGAGTAMQDLITGRVQLFITTPPSALGQIQTGTLRALAVASKTRLAMLPNVPTTAEAGLPGFELEAWFAIYGPAGMPSAIVMRLTDTIKKITSTTEFQGKLSNQGAYAHYLPPAQLVTLLSQDLAHWGKVIKDAGIAKIE